MKGKKQMPNVLRYHELSPQKDIAQYLHHLAFAFYPFHHKEKSPSNTGT